MALFESVASLICLLAFTDGMRCFMKETDIKGFAFDAIGFVQLNCARERITKRRRGGRVSVLCSSVATFKLKASRKSETKVKLKAEAMSQETYEKKRICMSNKLFFVVAGGLQSVVFVV